MAKTSSQKSSSNDNRHEVARILNQVLSDTYVLIVKTHNYHWNVTGPAFYGIHKLLEEQYNELFEAVDEIAERIRALGEIAHGSMKSFLSNASIKEAPDVPPKADAMIRDLLAGHESLRARLVMAEEVTDKYDDKVSNGMIVERMTVCEKTIWMLRSSLA